MSYRPDPFHTRHIHLPRELMDLQEILAENVHDMWARQRIAEGWVYGPERLRSYFGADRIVTASGCLPAITGDDVVVALLSETATPRHDKGGLPLDDVVQLEASGVVDVFARDGMVVPVLLDGAVMPAHTLLPESMRKLAFRHALATQVNLARSRIDVP